MSARRGPGYWARRRAAWRGWARWKRWSVTFVVAVLVVLLVGGIGIYTRLSSNLDVTDIDTALGSDRPSAASGPSAPITVLVIGSDTRKDVGRGYGVDDGTKRSDALMLVHVAGDRSRIDAVQIPRDTMIDRPRCKDDEGNRIEPGRAQINGVLDHGAACLVKTVESLTDNRVDHYIEIDFRGFARMINALGGLPICLEQPMVDSQARLDLPAGQQTLGGRDALAPARTRHAVGDGSDIGRLAHQQVVMSAVVQRAQSSAVLTRPDRLLRFVDAVTSSLTVDKDLDSVGALAGLAREIREVPSADITFATMPWGADPVDPNRVVPTEAAGPLFARMAADEPIDPKQAPTEPTEPTEAPQPPSSPIDVLNAGGAGGSATDLADRLREADVSIGEIGNAVDRDETVVQHADTTEARRDARRVARMLGLDVDTRLEVADVDAVTVLVGADSRTEPLEVDGEAPDAEPSETTSPSPGTDDLQTSKASQKACA